MSEFDYMLPSNHRRHIIGQYMIIFCLYFIKFIRIVASIGIVVIISPIIGFLYIVRVIFPPKLYARVIHSLFESIYTDTEITLDGSTNINRYENPLNLQFNEFSDGNNKKFDFLFVIPYILKGNQDIINDEVTKHFSSSQIEKWNILTRNYNLSFSMSHKLKIKYILCFIVRYAIMLPIRLIYVFFALLWLFVTAMITVSLPSGRFRTWFYESTFSLGINLSLCSFSYVRFHDEHYKPQKGSICVTNHTSPLDAIVLSRNQIYSLTGQRFKDICANFQLMLSSCANHIWFDRAKVEERQHVIDVLTKHVSQKNNYPILIFPEGTCINNKAVMMFNKGSFEVPNVTIYPIVMKYDHLYADPFWNSSRFSFSHFILRLMTSWCLFCDVYYLPPQKRKDNETSIEFAARVKQMIAEKGGMINLDWNGNLKRKHPNERVVKEAKKRLTMELMSQSSIGSSDR